MRWPARSHFEARDPLVSTQRSKFFGASFEPTHLVWPVLLLPRGEVHRYEVQVLLELSEVSGRRDLLWLCLCLDKTGLALEPGA